MYEIKQRVSASHTDSEGSLKFVAAMDMMQDCSQLWMESEPAFEQYFREHGVVQMLVSRQVDIRRMPRYGERLSIRTSVYECQGFLGMRNTAIYDEALAPCLLSWATGAFVSLETGRPQRIPPEQLARITMDPKIEMEYRDRKIALPESAAETLPPVRVSRNDIDFNRHMNNARYIQLAMEYLPAEFVLSQFRIEYKRPAKYGDPLYPRIIRDGSDMVYILLTGEDEAAYTVMELSAEKWV